MYAGDESAYRGIKEERVGGDDAVRPEFTSPLMGVDEHGRDIFRLHQYLIGSAPTTPVAAHRPNLARCS